MMSVQELADVLMNREDWGMIAEALKNIAVKEETCMF
jgi:hypothetical protein